MPDPERSVIVLAECYADTILIDFLTADEQLVGHAYGISEVVKQFKKRREDPVRMVGVIDNDKEKFVPPYLKDFVLLSDENRIMLKKKPGIEQYLIVLDKAVESFLLWNAEQVGYDVTGLGFSNIPKVLGRRLKYDQLDTDADYITLLSELHARQAPGFITLEQILNDVIAA